MATASSLHREALHKVVLIGNFGVGKTSIFYRMKSDTFPAPKNITGVDRCECTIHVQGKDLRLSLWDTAGVEQYKRTLTTNHYRYANVCVCVYDVTKLDTLDSLQYWLADAKLYGPQNLTFILCGNKIDLLEEESNDEEKVEDVTRSAESLRDSFPHFSSHVLTSCKKAGKLETLKEEIAKQLLGQKVDKPKDIIIPGQNPGKNRCC